MASLIDKFHEILRKYGHNVVVRKERDGTVTWERHTVRSKYPAFRGVPQVAEDRPEGIVHTVDMIFYFKANAMVREGDMIYEDDERYDNKVIFTIDYAIPQRAVGGNVAYYVAGCTRSSPQ